jgi:uncharacterized protein YlxW (UPF0749 family)
MKEQENEQLLIELLKEISTLKTRITKLEKQVLNTNSNIADYHRKRAISDYAEEVSDRLFR